jgi:CubicO group peptidase (beta-lactamase class C family)
MAGRDGFRGGGAHLMRAAVTGLALALAVSAGIMGGCAASRRAFPVPLPAPVPADAAPGAAEEPGDAWDARPSADRALGDTLRGLLVAARRDSVTPGAIAVVGSRAGVRAWATAGTLDWDASPAVDARTLWDLASLTKLVALTTTVATLVDDGTLVLDVPVQRWVPEWTGPMKDQVTLRDLLLHRSGLPAHRNFYLEARGLEAVRARVLATPLEVPPRTRMVYSDLGAILLGLVVERATGLAFGEAVRRRVLGPAGMSETLFNPPPALWRRTAPTERDPWRGRLVLGEVHDENAFAMGGVSSHAGLFATARDMVRFGRLWLGEGTLDGVRLFSPETARAFAAVADSTFSSRAIGWDTPTGTNSAGTLVRRPAYGHTGFTGTSLWIAPQQDRFVLLLTNRVNPRRERSGIGPVRIRVADAAFGGNF